MATSRNESEIALERLRSVFGVHHKIAETIAGGVLHCAQCQRAETPTDEQVEEYLRRGWPRCCGATMLYRSRLEISRSRKTARRVESNG